MTEFEATDYDIGGGVGNIETRRTGQFDSQEVFRRDGDGLLGRAGHGDDNRFTRRVDSLF